MANSAPDLLTSLPAEILIKVIANLPDAKEFLAVSQTSTRVRQFMKAHAAAICNTSIRTYFPDEADCLQARLVEGWLVPSHPKLLEEEARYVDGVRKRDKLPRPWITNPMSEPGPQFLRMLPNIRRAYDRSKQSRTNLTLVQCAVRDMKYLGLDELRYTSSARNGNVYSRCQVMIWYYGSPDEDYIKTLRWIDGFRGGKCLDVCEL